MGSKYHFLEILLGNLQKSMRQPAPPVQTVTRTPSSASTSSTISTSSSEEEWSTSHQRTELRSESGYSSLDLEEPYNTTTKDKSSLQGQPHSVVKSKGHTGLDRKWTETAESKSKTDDEEERLRLDEENEREDLRKTEMRIKELQSSIMSLDWQLERTQIEKMKKKTEKVQKRMSLSLSTDHWDFV